MAENKERSCYTCFHRPACAGMMEAKELADYVSLGPQSSGRCPDYIYSGDVSAVPQWIPADERLPQNYISVLVYIPTGEPLPMVHEAYIGDDGEWHSSVFYGIENEDVTHWMPMPEAPKEVPENETL